MLDTLHRLVVGIGIALLSVGVPWMVEARDEAASDPFYQALLEDLDYDYLFKGFAVVGVREATDNTYDYAPSDLVPYEHFLTAELRLDLQAEWRWLRLALKPRFTANGYNWESGTRDEWDTETDVFINRWIAQVEFLPSAFASYGRENLQWGPSFLTSPSNPFSSENGRNTPNAELPGMDFAKLIWVANQQWTGSFLVNTDPGLYEYPYFDFTKQNVYALMDQVRELAYDTIQYEVPGNDPVSKAVRRASYANIDAVYAQVDAAVAAQEVPEAPEFETTYAAKLDCTIERRTFSLIGSMRPSEDPRLGGFAGWTVSDSDLLYTEGNVTFGEDFAALAGWSHTFENGVNVAVEYLHNSYGDSDTPFVFLLPPFAEYDPRQLFFRQNYFFAQYFQANIFDRMNAVVRWTFNLDDLSHRFAGQVDYALNDYLKVFANAVVDAGDEGDEYGSFIERLGALGLELTY